MISEKIQKMNEIGTDVFDDIIYQNDEYYAGEDKVLPNNLNRYLRANTQSMTMPELTEALFDIVPSDDFKTEDDLAELRESIEQIYWSYVEKEGIPNYYEMTLERAEE